MNDALPSCNHVAGVVGGRPNTDTRRVLLAIVLLALLVRIPLCVQAACISRDGAHFVGYAKKLESDPAKWMRIETKQPGYAYLLLGGHRLLAPWIGGDAPEAWQRSGELLALIGGVASCACVYLLTRRLFDPSIAAVAGILACLWPQGAHLSADTLSDMPHLGLYLAALVVACDALSGGRAWRFALCGLLVGMAYLLRQEAIGLLAAVGLCILWSRTLQPRRRRILALAALLIPFALAVAPYSIARGQIMPNKGPQDLLDSSFASARSPQDVVSSGPTRQFDVCLCASRSELFSPAGTEFCRLGWFVAWAQAPQRGTRGTGDGIGRPALKGRGMVPDALRDRSPRDVFRRPFGAERWRARANPRVPLRSTRGYTPLRHSGQGDGSVAVVEPQRPAPAPAFLARSIWHAHRDATSALPHSAFCILQSQFASAVPPWRAPLTMLEHWAKSGRYVFSTLFLIALLLKTVPRAELTAKRLLFAVVLIHVVLVQARLMRYGETSSRYMVIPAALCLPWAAAALATMLRGIVTRLHRPTPARIASVWVVGWLATLAVPAYYLARPVNYADAAYRTAGLWLRERADPDDRILAHERLDQLMFYSGRGWPDDDKWLRLKETDGLDAIRRALRRINPAWFVDATGSRRATIDEASHFQALRGGAIPELVLRNSVGPSSRTVQVFTVQKPQSIGRGGTMKDRLKPPKLSPSKSSD